MTSKRVAIGSGALLAFVVAYAFACALIPADSHALGIVSDVGFLLPQMAALVLCGLAFRTSRANRDRWIWLLVGMWLALNLLADSAWACYELVRGVEVPSPGVTDAGYLLSYAVAFAAVLVAAWKTSGGLRMVETLLDAAMFTIGAAALSWPLLLGPLLAEAGSGAGYLVTLAYPLGDLLFLFGFASFFLAPTEPGRVRPQPYLLFIGLAFLAQGVADSAYLMITAVRADYGPGSWLDPVWLTAFALAGVAALLALRSEAKTKDRDAAPHRVEEPPARPLAAPAGPAAGPSPWRILIPYAALPILAAVVVMQVRADGWRWDQSTRILAYLGAALVGLLLLRQYVAILQNRRLNASLSCTSRELEERVSELADLNKRLAVLNEQSHQLNSLHELPAVAACGLELACTFSRSSGGWITFTNIGGEESTIATQGPVEDYDAGDPQSVAALVDAGELRELPLRIRDERMGTVWLARPSGDGPEADLLPVIAGHLATALDNARRYEEALHLAERDALTGLFNHRGIHRRLAGATLRAQQSGYELSLVMIDLDDFKALNDTYGHPAGDAVLKQVSDAVRAVLRHADLAGRVGGDELLLVLPNTGADGAFQLGERLRVALAARPYVSAGGHSIPVRLSLGIATYPDDAQSLGQLLETADNNLYASKQQGGDTVTGSRSGRAHVLDDDRLLGVAGRLLDVVGARDHHTRRHSESVQKHALALGAAVGLPADSMRTLHVAAMLHDVGKIGVPADLLSSSDALSTGERHQVNGHAGHGTSVIADMARLAKVAEAVRAHHERYDETGYPEEASGDEIPLLGRILAISDSYSAMTLERPYRRRMTEAQARAELLKAAGTQLDPALVRIFIGLLDAQEPQETEAQQAAAG